MNDGSGSLGKQFPAISAHDLEGKQVAVPADLTGTSNLVILAFAREHQMPVEAWLPHLAELERDFPGLEVWEVPVIARSFRLLRGAIDGGMRAGIADVRMRAHVLVAYLDLPSLQRSLALPDLRDIHLYLLDGSGIIRWHMSGAWTEAKMGQLTDALRAPQG